MPAASHCAYPPPTFPVAATVWVRLFSRLFSGAFKRCLRHIRALVLLVSGLWAGTLAAGGLLDFLAPGKSIKSHGGAVFTLRLLPAEDANGVKLPLTKVQIDQAIKVLEKRLKAAGARDVQVIARGEDGLVVEIPGVTAEDSKPYKSLLEKVGKLELREVSPLNEEIRPGGKSLAARVAANEEILPGYRAYIYKHKDADGNEMATPILLNRRAAIIGKDIALATPSPQQADAVSIMLNKEGAAKMIALTKNMQAGRDRIAIVLDGVVLSAPVVNAVPLGKNFIIQGLSDPGAVQTLANALMSPMETALVIEEERVLPPPENLKQVPPSNQP